MPTPLRRRMRHGATCARLRRARCVVFVALLVGVAKPVLPLAERHPDRIAAWLSERAGRPVRFEKVETAWTRRGPLLRLDDLRLGDGAQSIVIGDTEMLVSLYAGLLPGGTFSELRLRGLDLTVERAADGLWSVRGLPGQQQERRRPLRRARTPRRAADHRWQAARWSRRRSASTQRCRASTCACAWKATASARRACVDAAECLAARRRARLRPQARRRPRLRRRDEGRSRRVGTAAARHRRGSAIRSRSRASVGRTARTSRCFDHHRRRRSTMSPCAARPCATRAACACRTRVSAHVEMRARLQHDGQDWRFDAPKLRIDSDGRTNKRLMVCSSLAVVRDADCVPIASTPVRCSRPPR